VVTKINWLVIVRQKITDYKLLVKFGLNIVVVISAIAAYLTTANGIIDWSKVFTLGVAGFLVTGAANALNEVLEKDYDKLMNRTANRPIAAGRMSSSEAVLAAGLMSVVGLCLLALFNPLTVFLGSLSLISYAFIYTPLKRVSPIAVLVGAIPGALPVLIGSVAVTGHLTTLSIALFAIQFLWQFPHFWAIAWVGDEDYKKAGFNLLPSQDGRLDKTVGWNALVYTAFLIPVGCGPYVLGFTGLFSAVVLVILGLGYSYFAYMLYKKCTREAARSLMFSSFLYLPIAQLAMVFDKI
jgi:protoheme IX farnesyltransferase